MILKQIKDWAEKEKKESYSDFLNARLELDSEFYQGKFFLSIKLLQFIESLEQQYVDDFK